MLQILIEGCRIDYLKENIDKKIMIEVLGLKIDGWMHNLPKLTGVAAPVTPAPTRPWTSMAF